MQLCSSFITRASFNLCNFPQVNFQYTLAWWFMYHVLKYFMKNIPFTQYPLKSFWIQHVFPFSKELFFKPKIKMTDNKTKDHFFFMFGSLGQYDFNSFLYGKEETAT